MILTLAFSTVLIGIAFWARLATGTWLHPAAMFPGWWMLAGVSPLVFAKNEPVSTGAIAWVIIACVAVSAGAIAGNGGIATRRVSRPQGVSRFERALLVWPMLIALVLGMLSNVAFALGSGISFGQLLDLERLVIAANQAYVARYAEIGAAPAPPFSQALLPFVYLAPALGGLVFVIAREWRWKIFALLTMMPAIAVTVLQTTKAAVLFSGTLWLCSYFAVRLRFGNIKVITRAHVVVASVLVFVVTVFFFGVGLARLATTDTSLTAIVRVKLVTAAFGHMSVFSSWLSDYWTQSYSPTLGAYTFAGPLEMMGLRQRIPGIFENVVELIAGETSNIYTGFRPLIQDFTMPGALAILACLGVVAGASYRAVAAGNWGAVPVLVAAYMTMLWTPITWFWIYNSLTATVVAVGLIVFFIRLWRRSRHVPFARERFATTAQ
ncbi:MAG TPA: O-antigen polymerase [Gemmatimonadaceae bacterium]